MKRHLILVCNSHIDLVWLWGWEEGLAETISTFRTAVKFCEEYEDFVFCHNESLLYEWVEQYEPKLFERIKTQVKEGRWHIMGGWYLQADCNMMLGESIVRQIITGKKYFLEKFGKEPTTAINFDSYGHSRGLVQILASAGYDSYLFCSPDGNHLDLPGDTFQWVGYDGSIIMAHRVNDHYNSQFGLAGKKIVDWINNPHNKETEPGLLLWGIGNHGGGASEIDIQEIRNIKREEESWEIIHGTPEKFFSHFSEKSNTLTEFKGNLNPFAIGCYTSMKSVKQVLYKLEHKFYTAEKLLSVASSNGWLRYPSSKMEEALKELLFCHFHDILPGSSVETIERDVLNRIGHATRIIEKETASLFIDLANSLKPASSGEFPIMLINPHPFDTDEIVELELQLPEPGFDKNKIRVPQLFNENGESILAQSEKPECNIKEDHRKRIAFNAKIPSGKVVRYSCFLKDIPKQEFKISVNKGLIFEKESSKLVIDKRTGFPVSWSFMNSTLFGSGLFRFAVLSDNADPWGMGIKSFSGDAEYFKLMSVSEASEFAGFRGKTLESVYISECGDIRTIVESLFSYNNSRINLKYLIPARKDEFDVEITVYWMEKDKILKWMIPVGFNMNCVGRSLSGISCFKHRKREYLFRDWLGVKNFTGENTFSICSDGAYGFDINGNTIGISLLRAPAYSCHPVEGEDGLVMNDRAVKRMDQGVNTFRFRFIPGNNDEIIDKSFNHSDLFNNPVISRIVYPSGNGKSVFQGIKISDDTINLQAVKLNENGDLVLRLLNPCKELKRFEVNVPAIDARAKVEINPKAIKTFIVKEGAKKFLETDLMERKKS